MRKYKADVLIVERANITGQGKREIIQDLGKILGLSESQVYRIVSAKAEDKFAMTTDQLMAIASYFGVAPGKLLNVRTCQATTN